MRPALLVLASLILSPPAWACGGACPLPTSASALAPLGVAVTATGVFLVGKTLIGRLP